MASIRGAIVLYNSSAQFTQTITTPVVGSSTPSFYWYGGRSVICFDSSAGIYPPVASNLQVQVQMPAGSWVQAGSGVIQASVTASGYFPCDLPPGQYRVFSNSSITSITGLCVSLVGIDYGQ